MVPSLQLFIFLYSDFICLFFFPLLGPFSEALVSEAIKAASP